MELHNILCFCYHGKTMSAAAAPVRLRGARGMALAANEPLMFDGGINAVLIAIGALTI